MCYSSSGVLLIYVLWWEHYSLGDCYFNVNRIASMNCYEMKGAKVGPREWQQDMLSASRGALCYCSKGGGTLVKGMSTFAMLHGGLGSNWYSVVWPAVLGQRRRNWRGIVRLCLVPCKRNFFSTESYQFEVLNEVYLQNFLHRLVVNRETNLMMLINSWLSNN